MIDNLRSLYSYRDLLLLWTLREVRVRYKQSFLGAAWAILQPLALMVMFTVVFSFFARVPSGGIPYPLFSYTALLPWTFFATSIAFSVPSLVNNLNLVTKIYFPREILPLSSIGAAFLDFVIASSVFIALMVFYQMPIRWSFLWIPVLVSIQVAIAVGVVFFSSALTVWYRDLRFVVPLGVQLLMYASPIIYPVTLVPERLVPIYMVNPMAGLIVSYRGVILHGTPPTLQYLGTSAVIGLGLMLGGYLFFKRAEIRFADVI